MDDETLVEAVRAYECLWKVGAKSYKDIIAKENAWKEVAASMGEGVTATQCSHRWKALRDRFVRELKKTKPRSGDSGPPVVPSWPLFQTMLFLSDTVKHKATATNFTLPGSKDEHGDIDQTSDIQEDELDLSAAQKSTSSHVSTPARQLSVPPSQEPTSHKRKRTQSSCDEVDVALLTRLQKLQEQQDGEAAFGEHVAACLRQLSPRLRAIARIEIDKVLMHLQFPDDSYSEPCSSFSTFYGCS